MIAPPQSPLLLEHMNKLLPIIAARERLAAAGRWWAANWARGGPSGRTASLKAYQQQQRCCVYGRACQQ